MLSRIVFLFIIIILNVNLFSQLTNLESTHTNILFENLINETQELNILNYDYLYNGGGVGVIDVNNDGLEDLFFTGNFVNDKLYINQGNHKYVDATVEFEINRHGWSTGVLIFDINNDGFDDIYICRSGIDSLMNGTTNVLYINHKGEKFIESSKAYNLDLSIGSIQAAPLDFDRDGDLDLYIITHPLKFNHSGSFNSYYLRIIRGEIQSDLLLENINGKYYNVTKQAGIFEYGYSLGVSITDLNLDNYPDIIVSNDFDEPDHVFINQTNGKFNDESLKYFKHTSNYSKGNDIGDINNDGLLDFVCLDMAYSSHSVSKLNLPSIDSEKFNSRVDLGWNNQYMHNVLQLNTGLGSFQEISFLAKIAQTGWSWGPLITDINCDGWNDLLISNGYKRNTKNNDLFNKINNLVKNGEIDKYEQILELIPTSKTSNKLLINNKDLTFSEYKLSPSFNKQINSNGIVISDIDNDGDMDIVFNNVDAQASVYRNDFLNHSNFSLIDFSKMEQRLWLGAKVYCKTKKNNQIKEAYFVKGYQSSVSKRIPFYFTEDDKLVSIEIRLSNGKIARYNKKGFIFPQINDFKNEDIKEIVRKKLYKEQRGLIDFIHVENDYDDFKKEVLLPHQISKKGPKIKVADFNEDGLDDVIIGGSVNGISSVFLQDSSSHFHLIENTSFFLDQQKEVEGIHISDLNKDGHLDLFFSYGGYQFKQGIDNLKNSWFLGDGNGHFGKISNENLIDDVGYNSGKIIANDFNLDGKDDYLICGSANPINYPSPGRTSIVMNNQGRFQDFTKIIAPELEYIGMVEDAVFSDVDGDNDLDIVVVGEWMDVVVFKNDNGRFSKLDIDLKLQGWWNRIKKFDFDNDGDDDYLIGNAGLNNKFNPSIVNPLELYLNDFDNNGVDDIVMAQKEEGILYPIRGKRKSTDQTPFLLEKFTSHEVFANSNLGQIYSLELLEASYMVKVVEFRSGIIENKGNFQFKFHPFSNYAQTSSIKDFIIDTIGGIRIIAIGNEYSTEVGTTRNDASCGVVLLQEKNFNFKALYPFQSGLYVPNDSKTIEEITFADGLKGFVVGSNSTKIKLFKKND